MKRITALILAAAAVLLMAAAVNAGEQVQEKGYERLVSEVPADVDIETKADIEKANSKNLAAIKDVFEETSYKAYTKAVSSMKKEMTEESIDAAVKAREALEMICPFEDKIQFIWDGNTMPCIDGEELSEEEINTSQMFGTGFEPVIIKFLVADQSTCKGNIIACSGGAMKVWANGSEGYPAAGVFNDLGYNFFLLQRRVEPYADEDIFMDYQRAVRVMKNIVKNEGLGGSEMFAGVGWSGGSWTLMGAVNNLYGYTTPQKYDSDYEPDAVDAISADLDVAMAIYGGTLEPECGNPSYPALYICQGTQDTTVDPQCSYDMKAKADEIGIPSVLNMIEGAEHGFGVGLKPATGQAPGTEEWPAQADVFMQSHLNYQQNRY